MSVYLFGAIERNDPVTYALYEQAGFASLAKYGIEVLAATDTPEAIEGDVPAQRIVLMRFNDRAALEKWYNSPQYQLARPLRQRSADTRFLFAFDGLSL